MKKFFIIFLFLCVSAISAMARDFNVTVAVRADSDEMSQQVENYLLGELSQLKDVRISQNGDWSIRVMVLENKVPEGSEKSYTLSAVITSESKCTVINTQGKTVSAQECDRFENFGVFAGTKTNLKDMCEELIADFDANNLDPLR
ncbi:MAG: hypothetical protein R2747_17690 [Pyrinomonadaceae bacterium]